MNCLAPEWAVLGFRAEVHKVMVVGESCDAKEIAAGFYREALEVLAESLVEEFLLPANPGGYLNWIAVTVTACKKLEHNSVGRESWVAAVDVSKEFPAGLEKLDRDRESLGEGIKVLA